MKYPILYSFKRCPYAMRARMALQLTNIKCEIREVRLNNKPKHMLEVSPKGTVPVLILNDRTIEESMEVIDWALNQKNVFEGNLKENQIKISDELIERFDDKFKYHLDRYKYASRYGGVAVSYFEWVKNLRHIRFGRLEKRRNQIQLNTLIEAIETMTGKSMPEKYKEKFVDGIEEIDLIRSGLDDMMIDGFQNVKEEFLKNEKIPDFRTAAYKTAIEKIALSYEFIGL